MASGWLGEVSRHIGLTDASHFVGGGGIIPPSRCRSVLSTMPRPTHAKSRLRCLRCRTCGRRGTFALLAPWRLALVAPHRFASARGIGVCDSASNGQRQHLLPSSWRKQTPAFSPSSGIRIQLKIASNATSSHVNTGGPCGFIAAQKLHRQRGHSCLHPFLFSRSS